MITDEKILFDDAFLKEIQDKFYYVHEDYLGRFLKIPAVLCA